MSVYGVCLCVFMSFWVIICVFLCLCMWACGCLSVSLQVYIFVLYECVYVCVFVLYVSVLVCVSVCVRGCNVHHVAHCVRGSPLCYDSPWGEHDLCLRLSQHFAKQDDYLSGNMKTSILPKKILNISERWKQLTKEARAKSSFKWLQLKGL